MPTRMRGESTRGYTYLEANPCPLKNQPYLLRHSRPPNQQGFTTIFPITGRSPAISRLRSTGNWVFRLTCAQDFLRRIQLQKPNPLLKKRSSQPKINPSRRRQPMNPRNQKPKKVRATRKPATTKSQSRTRVRTPKSTRLAEANGASENALNEPRKSETNSENVLPASKDSSPLSFSRRCKILWLTLRR